MMQVGASYLQAEHFVATVLDRFQLATWFSPEIDEMCIEANENHNDSKAFDISNRPLHAAIHALNLASGSMLIAPPVYLKVQIPAWLCDLLLCIKLYSP